MNPLIYSSIESVAYQNYFERSEGSQAEIAVFASSRHSHQVAVVDDGTTLFFYSHRNTRLLQDKFPEYATDVCLTICHPANDLTNHLHLLGSIFETAASMSADPEVSDTPVTEAIEQVKERLGQHIYRTRLLANWDNACAVTGLTDPRLLRASHAKPWKDATDTERLDPANGFPLAVHLDALFDAGLISFANGGIILMSPSLSQQSMDILGITPNLHLRLTLSPQQRHFLAYHRENIFISSKES